MRFDLTATTDAGEYAIFDPSTVPDLGSSLGSGIGDVGGEIAKGNILGYSCGGDGDISIRFYIGEEPDAELIRRACNGVRDALLRVPSGLLAATGLEGLPPWPPAAAAKGQPPTGQCQTIPPGSYLVEAFEVGWGEEDEDAVRAAMSRRDRWIEQALGVAMGCVVFSTLVVLPVALYEIWRSSGAPALWTTLKYVLLFEAVFWPAAILIAKSTKAFQRASQTRRRTYALYPRTVVVLRRPPEGVAPEGPRGGRFGIGFRR